MMTICRSATLGAWLVLFMLSGCGYRPVLGQASRDILSVVLVQSTIVDAVAADEVVAGVRRRLAQEGALASGDGYPRIEVEVLRIDERAEGIVATSGRDPEMGSVPRARGLGRGLVARAWLRRDGSAPTERDTGDVRAFETIASPALSSSADGLSATLSALDATRATARRLGDRLASMILGVAAPTDEASAIGP